MNKKVLILTVCSLFVLVAAVIATSFAAYSASITGTEVQSLGSNGYASMSCSDAQFNVTNANVGQKATYTCDLAYNLTGTMTIGYDFGLTGVSCSSGATCLIDVKKNGTAISGLTNKNITSLASSKGTYDTAVTYKLDSGTLSSTTTVKYTIDAWISAAPANSTSTTEACSDPKHTTAEACKNAGEIWGNKQSATQGGATFSFKAMFGAKQI